MPFLDLLSLLKLTQLADSALPIGSLSHSFGLESLVADGDIGSDSRGNLPWYIEDALEEALFVDAVFCREAHTRGAEGREVGDLNRHLSALRLARESREASLTLGRRFAALVASVHRVPSLQELSALDELHYCVAFGFALGEFAIPADLAVGAFLHQSVLNMISAAQRLMPLGQREANRIAWDLKPAIAEAVERSRTHTFMDVPSFAHLPESASMRHAVLSTRLFIS